MNRLAVFHMPHITVNIFRATVCQALLTYMPPSTNCWNFRANMLSPWPMALQAAPSIAAFSRRFTRYGNRNLPARGRPCLSVPLVLRCRPTPQYFHSFLGPAKRYGVSR